MILKKIIHNSLRLYFAPLWGAYRGWRAAWLAQGRRWRSTATKPQNSLDEMLAQCDLKSPAPKDVKAWDEAAPVGKEVL